MSGKLALDRRLEELRTLRDSPDGAEKALLRALQDRNGFFVSKAAVLVGDMQLTALIPDLETAFERFLKDPVKTDPQCWAKIAIIKALRRLEHKEPAVFLRGLSHVQREPVWGGDADTAGPLRGSCALALVGCRLSDLEILGHLTVGLADPEKVVRLDTASAIAALGSEMGALLLRLKALLGDKEPEVIGQCFAALLDLGENVAFVKQFLGRSHSEEIQGEAIAALAQARGADALGILQELWKGPLSGELRRMMLLSLAGSPVPASSDFLLKVLGEDSKDNAKWAAQALGASRFRGQVEDRVRMILDHNPEVREMFERERG